MEEVEVKNTIQQTVSHFTSNTNKSDCRVRLEDRLGENYILKATLDEFDEYRMKKNMSDLMKYREKVREDVHKKCFSVIFFVTFCCVFFHSSAENIGQNNFSSYLFLGHPIYRKVAQFSGDTLYFGWGGHVSGNTLYIGNHVSRNTLYIGEHVSRDTLYIGDHYGF